MNKALFISLGGSAPAWYRCGLVANQLQQDWAGMLNSPPPYGTLVAGNINSYPNPEDYSVIVVQQIGGEIWEKEIASWKKQGIKVLYEIDDFVHGVKKVQGHTFQKHYHKKKLKLIQSAMDLCDGLICSTEFLADQYSKYNENVFVCKNGIDTWRYNNQAPQRETVNIGWSGGTGHHLAVGDWLEEISFVLNAFPETRFVSIGTDYAQALQPRHENQTISIPWVSIENYPHALQNIDIAIAPAHDSKYFKSKSELRWLEAGASSICVIADKIVYSSIEDEKTGILVEDSKEVCDCLTDLVMDKTKIKTIGQASQAKIQSHYDISITSKQWLDVFNQIV